MATKKEMLASSQEAMASFIKLSAFLLSEDAPFDINEIPEDHPYYQSAKAIADEMEVDWKTMSHEDSNRIVLNLLTDFWNNINPDDKYRVDLTISFKPKKD